VTFPAREDVKAPKTPACRGLSRSPARAWAQLALIAALVLAIAGCGDDATDRLNAAVHTFADALNNADAQAAAAVTTDAAQASDTLGKLFDSLGRNAHFEVSKVDHKDNDATFGLAATWKFGKDGRDEWTYTTTGSASQTGDVWKIRWDRATVAPGLGTGPLSYSTLSPDPAARVLDRTGADLLTQQVVTLVNVSPGADVNAVAALLNPIDTSITADSLQSQLSAGNDQPVTAITLRAEDSAPIEDALSAMPNVTLAKQTRLLTTGWAISAQTATGSQRVGGQDPKPVADINSTLDIGVSHAAEEALAPIPTPAVMVVIQPSTGDVLAVGQNPAADAQGPIALTGLYPPGSTFKTVTVSAALQAGQETPDSIVACPGTENIEGRQIPNDDNFDLGQVPLHTAFARSCNTTMGRLAVNLPADGLTKAAAQLGLGIDYTAPGMTTVTGKVPVADTSALRVEEGIGQGQVTASPFGMALVAATLAHGSVPSPTIVAGQPGKPDHAPDPLPAGVDDQVKSMMRETIMSGTATQLQDIPGMLGKTGTAEYIDNTHAHGWFVGIDGDLALAVFISDAGSSAPAVDAAGRFLRALK
jgi:hypothetical protein